jgi:hypothetical protein
MALNTDAIDNDSKKPQPQAGQGFQAERPKAKPKETKSRKSDNQLVVHQHYEAIAKGLSEQSENRLAALTSAVVANRDKEADKFVDVLEMVDSGELDLHLIVTKLQQRREQRELTGAPSQEFNFNIDGFDTRGYGIALDKAITEVALEPIWTKKPAALLES